MKCTILVSNKNREDYIPRLHIHTTFNEGLSFSNFYNIKSFSFLSFLSRAKRVPPVVLLDVTKSIAFIGAHCC
jgi:lipoprotein signal peptidase